MGRHDDLLYGAGVPEYGDPGYDWVDVLIDTDPIELGRRTRRLAAALRDEIANGDRLRRDVGHVIAAYEDLPHVIDVLHLMGLLRKATCTLPDGGSGMEPWQWPTSSEVET